MLKNKLTNRLQQLFAQNQPAKATGTGLTIKNEGNETTIYLYDAIGGWVWRHR
jgi:hypothetical protein